MIAYYNENDPKAAAWLRELIKVGAIAAGEVDERSIEDVTPNDLRDFTQHHFFAGIGGWSYALRLAGWSDDRAVWTGSCPCQPFSSAGAAKGFADERHLWPAWFHLIQQCVPANIFGEQVNSALRWLELVQADLEGEKYAVGAAIIGAHSVGAPHIRQRIYWVADRTGSRLHANVAEQQPETVHNAGDALSHEPWRLLLRCLWGRRAYAVGPLQACGASSEIRKREELHRAEIAHRQAREAVEAELARLAPQSDRSAECASDHTAQKKAGWDHCPNCKAWL